MNGNAIVALVALGMIVLAIIALFSLTIAVDSYGVDKEVYDRFSPLFGLLLIISAITAAIFGAAALFG